MDIALALLTIVIGSTNARSIARDDCPVRDPSLTTCGRSCTPETGCRKAGRQCECAGECGWSCIKQEARTSFTRSCIKNNDEVNRLGRACARPCPSDGTCLRTRYSCICDGICGKSCIPVEQENYCDPALLSTNHATYTVDPPTAKFGSVAQYACADGFSPSRGDSVRTCTGGRSWNGSALVCWPNTGNACYDPPVVEHASHNGSKEYYLPGELLVYTCDYGFYRGSSIPLLMCQHTGDSLDWGRFEMTCLPKSCGYPGNIAHGRIEGSVYSFRSSVTYVCDIGYRIQGLATRYCQADQQWSGYFPQCIPVTCSTLSAPENGKMIGSNHGYNDVVSFTCNDGFILDGASNLRCQHNGTWGSPRPTCKAVSEVCKMQQNPTNGQWVKGSNCRDGLYQLNGCRLSYTCNENYIPLNSSVVYVCSEPEWDQLEEPFCKPVACYDPPVVEHASHNGNKEYYFPGEVLFYTCDFGYDGGNSIPLLTCQKSSDLATWENFDMTCSPKSCGHPGNIEHGRIEGSEFIFNTSVTYACKRGYTIQGTAIRHCQADQEWSGNLPQCIPKSCGYPGSIAHGSIEGSVYSFRSSVTYVCDIGYRIQGLATRHCQADQDWSGYLPQCIPVTCNSLSAPENGKIIGSNHGYNDMVSFTCNDSFILDGASNLRCQHDGTWGSPRPTCKAVSEVCKMQQNPTNGQWVKGSNCRDGLYQLNGCRLSYTCNENYIPVNSSVVYVCSEPEWNQLEEPFCKPVACYDPPVVEHASHNGNKEYYFPGEVLFYTCDFGYDGGNSIPLLTCQKSSDLATWENFEMTCSPVECRNMSAPADGKIIGSNHRYNDEVSFSCNDGFILDGASTLRCQHDGTWSSPPPTCNEVCSMPQDPTKGRWIKGSNCRDGQYQLQGCQLSYTCNEEYVPINTSVVYVCSEPEWDKKEEPLCKPDACYDPPVVENASHNGTKEYYWAKELLFYSCDSGYYRSGTAIPLLMCQKKGNTVAWGNFNVTCLPKSCGHPGNIEHGRIEGSEFIFNTSVTYACNRGYIIQGTAIRHCQADQEWSGNLPQCIPVECRNMSAPADGKIIGSNHRYNDEVSFSCNDGFILDGASTLRCQHDGTWSSPPPTCNEVCSMPQDPTNGRWIKGSNCRDGQYQLQGCQLSYTCNGEYVSINTSVVYVCSEPEWDKMEEPLCKPDACYDPPVVENASHNGTKEYYWAKELLYYSCDSGYYRSGTAIPLLMCQKKGNTVAWGNFNVTCLPKSCGYPGSIEHGRIEGSIYLFRSSVTYVCSNGYKILGNATRHCQADQEWSGELPQCIPTSCGHPGNIENGRIEGTEYSFPGSVKYVCDNGFRIQGNAIRHCQADQQWSGSLPQCIPVECRDLTAPENGNIIGSNHGFDDEVSFSCNDGFILNGASARNTKYNMTTPSSGSIKLMTFSDITPTSIKLSWPALDQTSDVESDLIVEYQIQIKEAEETDFRNFSAGRGLSYLFENLREDTEYEFRLLIFWNQTTFEEGLPSSVQRQRTLPKSPSYSVNNVITFTDVTPTSINAAWPAWNHDTDVGSGPISEYQIQIREAGETQFHAFSAGTSLTYLFENLRVNTDYEFRLVVFRKHATHGEGPPSNVQTQRTLPRPPSHSVNNVITFTDVTPTSINVSWPAWNHDTDVGSGPISEYQIQIREAGETQFRVISAGTSLTYLFENLRENTDYEFRLVVFRKHATHGRGPPSNVQTQRTLPRPILVVCSMPQDPINGQWVKGNGCQDGQDQFPECELSYTCNEEYVPANTSVVYVCSGPAWEQKEKPLCQPGACYNPPVVENGSHNGSNEYYLEGELLAYTCDYGYNGQGSLPLLLRCQQTGDTLAWGNFDMTCLPVECRNLTAPENGKINGSYYAYDDKVSFTCNDGFILDGASTLICQHDGNWSSPTPTCRAVECRNLSAPANGKIIGSNHGYNDEVSLSCNDGFILDGASTLRCQYDGNWSSPTPTCRGACYDPPVVEHASHNGNNEYYLAGELLFYTCDFGYHKGHSMSILMCQQTGETVAWGNFSMICLPKSCGHPGNIANGRIEGSVYSFRSSVTYVCERGYKRQGNATRYCQADQKWSGKSPKCIIVTSQACNNSALPYGLLAKDGSQRQGYTSNNDWLRVRCEDNMQLLSGYLLKCESGEWVNTTSCRVKPAVCSMPQDPTNGQWIKGNNCKDGQYQMEGCQLLYTCNKGFVSANTGVVYACSGTAWDRMEEPLCRPDACYDPPVVENASHNGSKEYYVAGELLVYTCDVGYHNGNSMSKLMCNQIGDTVSWGNFEMTCLLKSCGHPGDIEHARIEGSVFSFRSYVTYVCDVGYTVQGNATRYCQGDQQWSGNLPQCIIDTSTACNNSDLPHGLLAAGGRLRQGYTLNNDWLRVRCADNLQSSGGYLLKCESGEWVETTSCSVISPTSCDNSKLPDGYILQESSKRQGFTPNNVWIRVRCVGAVQYLNGIIKCRVGEWEVYHQVIPRK